MQQSDISSSYYQYYQSHFQNPNPSSNPNDPQLSPVPATFASAPPVSSGYCPSDHSDYSSTFPPFPQTPHNVPHLIPMASTSTYPPNPNSQPSNSSQPYSFPHLMSQPSLNYSSDQNQTVLNYDHSIPNYNSNPNSSFSMTSYSPASHGHPEASTVPNYKNQYESGVNFGGYGTQGMYGDIGEPRPEIGSRYDHGRFPDDVSGGGVYAYNGGNKEPYGARGSGSKGSTGVIFDDYGRPIGFTNEKEENGTGSLGRIVKAIPKTETQQVSKSGVQKFRVNLLSEGGSQCDMDVLCQIGLDGIQILDPATCRTLRIYPLETVTRWEVLDSYIFAFWAKSSIDIEPRRIRLKSNSYTTNNILDMVTAATIQLKEIGGRSKPSDSLKFSEQPSEKKKGFSDWMKVKPVNEEKYHWVPDETVTKCTACGTDFGAFVRKHHCRNCGDIFCDKCTQGRIALTADEYAQPVRVCDQCLAEVTQRLGNAKETAGKVAELQSHEDLAKKLQEEMDKNCKISTGLKSDGYGMQMKEVACPTCTVHLQVQVPASGSETIECSVCQHPFLVNAP